MDSGLLALSSIMFLAFGSADGLLCYSCSAHALMDNFCVDPFNNAVARISTNRTTCPPGEMCLKVKTSNSPVGFLDNVIRSCGYAREGCEHQEQGGTTTEVCGCSKELCNGSWFSKGDARVISGAVVLLKSISSIVWSLRTVW